MRLFLSIPMPEEVREVLEDVQIDLPAGRPADPDQFHLTLVFLDEQTEEAAQAIHEAMQGLRAEAVEVRLTGLELFGGRAPRVLHAGVADPEPLRALQSKVLARLRAAGVAPGRRRFRPHVTIARFGHLRRDEVTLLERFLTENGHFEAPPFTARAIKLVHSVLRTGGGARHETLADYPLG
ncbi:RNA 2',3'-cyclic phosphodiesterase [Rhodosalinus sp.]|uniref:RNA 2',3'-cyclic phosphodiesterase n=1 Tax=Rhodosalinus sp. TaxID=2047741 RepID=UPI00397D2507